MNKEVVEIFEGQEVKVITDKGETLINLVHTAKCCGLVRVRGNNKLIRWDDIKKKLSTICGSIESSTPQYIVEIKNILEEIDNTDDRNSIYMSSWLSKRLAMECRSEKAMRYKNYLATLDERYSKGELTKLPSLNLANIVSDTVNAIMPTLITEMTQKLIPTVLEAKNSVENMQSLMHDQATIYDQERDELKSMIGMRSRNVKDLTDKLKYELENKYNEVIKAKDSLYIVAKNKIFQNFNVTRWEMIPVQKYNDVFCYIEELFL